MPSEEYALQTFARFVKLSHVCAGVYIWEFFTTLDFEWEVYTGRRPWRWSFIVYVTARVLALICFVISLVGLNLDREFNCNAWLRFVLFTAWFAASSASLLLVLRGVAIWGRDIRIVILTGLFWLVNLGGAIYALTRGHVVWSPPLKACAISGTKEFTLSLTINFMEDFVLLSVMFFGVLHKRNATHLWNMLYFQALFWILAATFTELPSVALGLIDINGESTQSVLEVLFNRVLYPTDSWNMMFNTRICTLVTLLLIRRSFTLFQARDVDDFGVSDQNSNAMRRGRQPRGMHASPRPGGRDVQVTVTKTIEFDVELRPGSGSRALPGMAADVERAYSPPLTEEEQQIRTLELQMKHDLEI
ncbi:hypothetical protein BGY98DRAFT_1096990 [Russula aff. rugulosa BPL654]|nr:hypothetical protein BGY98DRAFT_1096990 [Russula aff. rugulosa BPL654]